MIYRVCIEANNVKTFFDFAEPVSAVNFMTTAFNHFSVESDDLADITMTIEKEEEKF